MAAPSPNAHVSKVVSQSVHPTEQGRSVNTFLWRVIDDKGIHVALTGSGAGISYAHQTVSHNVKEVLPWYCHLSSRDSIHGFFTELGGRCASHACRRHLRDIGDRVLTTSGIMSCGYQRQTRSREREEFYFICTT